MCVDALAKAPSCPPALAAMVEYYAAIAGASYLRASLLGGAAVEAEHQKARAALSYASELLEVLAQADPVRSLFWMHRKQTLEELEEPHGGDDAMSA